MCSNMKDLVETHLGYTALTNELECCFHSILLIFRRANRLVGEVSTIYFAKQKSRKVLCCGFLDQTLGGSSESTRSMNNGDKL